MDYFKKMIIGLGLLSLAVSAMAAEKDPPRAVNLNAAAVPAQRIIRSGDSLNITVWQHKDLSATVVVDENGNIEYLFAGLIPVAGKTVPELKEILRKVIAENYIVDPKIDISMDRRTMTFFITGEVQKPGTYEFKPGATMLEAVALAGGFTDYASRRVKIIRRDANGKEKELKINTKKLLRANNKRDQSKVEVDDIIVAGRAWW